MAPKRKPSASSSESSSSSSEQEDKSHYERKPAVHPPESPTSENEESEEGEEETVRESDEQGEEDDNDEESESEGVKTKPPTKARSSTTRSSSKDKGNPANPPASHSVKPLGSKPMDIPLVTDSPKSRATKSIKSPPPPSKRSEPMKSRKDDSKDLKKRKLSEVNAEGGGKQLFQRIWKVDEEIDLLKGFLDYSKKYPKGLQDHAAIYEFVQKWLNSESNKSQSQVVEKLKRLRKKFKNTFAKEEAGKEVNFKTPEEQDVYQISKKIWGCENTKEEAEFEENDSQKPNPSPVSNAKTRRISKANAVKKECVQNHVEGGKVPESMDPGSTLVGEWIQSGPSPHSHPGFVPGFGGLGFVGGEGLAKRVLGSMEKSKVRMLEEKWRRQQMLEMDAYLKRVELVHEQTKLMVETLKSMNAYVYL
ncbi:hypothetical protein AMTRI_Chr02g259970 [Amborella trichopoda]|uniref:Glabrous enhancer-binding protein-like DBD domain-containing protein n=1 Tax=Amborella trichopoda TaxID=13333 RepID=W1NQ08_AMBTC|nr:probable transcription factor At5g28040 [Amborella trichopoda]XP_020517684.1 probable transcription factor At5g28040 [Amborella trichopoda]XP_020517685.1 probable transcription factor At5g28040 [Amborella trichopoda]ERM97483.1 hypothetical protein AMTR_s00125p00070010 [Amborella trichopoda]|eukprot:XP_006830067.1 probable transcription factor At5g28040 [Amborella trichopoda]